MACGVRLGGGRGYRIAGTGMAALPAGPRMQALLRALLLIAALVLANLVFFRVPIFNGFTRLWGDHFDGGIEATSSPRR